MGGECFPENIFYFTGYTGRMVRILFLRDWDAICEEGGRKEDTWIGGDGGGGDVLECVVVVA